MLALLLATAALADPHGDAAVSIGAGYVGFSPGVAARGSLTAAHWGWAHVDGTIAMRTRDGRAGAFPYRSLGLEAGFTPPTGSGVVGGAFALERAWDEPCEAPTCFGGPHWTGWALGGAWAVDRDRHDFEAFVGVGSFFTVDLLVPGWRARLAWTLDDHLRVGVVSSSIHSLFLEVGAAL